MAATHIALLRGINVGKAKRVAMADLRALVEELGYEDARTLLNSGNVVFRVRAAAKGDPAARIEKALPGRFGIEARVIGLTVRELRGLARKNPLAKTASDPSRLLVAVLRRAADRKLLEAIAREDWSPDALAFGPRAAFLWCPNGQLESPLAEAVQRALGDAVTIRNAATIAKLLALAEGP